MPEHRDDMARVRHMLTFAQKAVAFNKGRSRSDLDSNEMLAMATIHLIEVIGEASRSVPQTLREKYHRIPWEAISGTRNRLAHGYVDVDLDIIWTIVTQDLPPLIRQLKRLLREEGGGSSRRMTL
jgi:uncharacterized protein with HEPN domain